MLLLIIYLAFINKYRHLDILLYGKCRKQIE